MASRTSSRKQRRNKRWGTLRERTNRLEILLTAALTLSSLTISEDVFAQSVTEDTTVSLGYLNYQDHQHNGNGIQVNSPALYFKTPLGPRTEIEGGIVYDSISGASAFNSAPVKQDAPINNIGSASSQQVIQDANGLPCIPASVDTLTKASQSVTTTTISKPNTSTSKPSSTSNSSNSTSQTTTGGASSGGSSAGVTTSGNTSGLPICGSTVGVLPQSQNTISPSSSTGVSQKPSLNNSERDDNEDDYRERNEDAREEGHSKLYRSALKMNSPEIGNATFSDSRTAGDLKVTHYMDSFSLGAGIAYSTENDYDSLSLSFDTRIWTPNKNTTFAFGFSTSLDKITSSADPLLSESKTSEDFLLGVTQVLSPNAIMQSNITFNNQDGYLTDSYRDADNRPGSRQGFAWLTRYNLFIEPFDAALHLDYRLYGDSWDIVSHMAELAWYQPLSSKFMLRPSVRYYTQRSAGFYSFDTTTLDKSKYSSLDQRLSSFGGITLGLKLIADLGAGFTSSVGYDYMSQSSDLVLGSPSLDASRDPLYAQFIFVEFTKKF